jgi:hypothetical protein
MNNVHFLFHSFFQKGEGCNRATFPFSYPSNSLRIYEELVVHVLDVTSINYGDGVAIDTVSIVPSLGICHVVTSPSLHLYCP